MDLLRFYYTQNPTPMEDEDLFDAYAISLNNITPNTYFTRLSITEVTSTGVIVNSTSHNNNLPSNNSYTIVRPNTSNTFQITGQMWNNTAPTGTLLSNWTATA